jgi:hypothetical protein
MGNQAMSVSKPWLLEVKLNAYNFAARDPPRRETGRIFRIHRMGLYIAQRKSAIFFGPLFVQLMFPPTLGDVVYSLKHRGYHNQEDEIVDEKLGRLPS